MDDKLRSGRQTGEFFLVSTDPHIIYGLRALPREIPDTCERYCVYNFSRLTPISQEFEPNSVKLSHQSLVRHEVNELERHHL